MPDMGIVAGPMGQGRPLLPGNICRRDACARLVRADLIAEGLSRLEKRLSSVWMRAKSICKLCWKGICLRMENFSASVVLPTCNRNNDLLNSLKSIYKQTFKNFEVLIVNDGDEQISDFLARQAGFLEDMDHKILNTKGRSGPSNARNVGLARAKGDIVFYLDDDDAYYPEHLQVHMDEYRRSPLLGVVYSDANRGKVVYDAEGSPRLDISLQHSHDFDADKLLIQNYIPILCLSHKKSCLSLSGLFDPTLSYLEDWDFLIRLSVNYKFRHVKQTTAIYMEKGGGLSLQQVHNEKFLDNLFDVYQRSEKYLLDDQDRLANIWHMRSRHIGMMANVTGEYFEGVGNLELARNAFSNAVKFYPDPAYYVNLARVQKLLGHHLDALISLQTAKLL